MPPPSPLFLDERTTTTEFGVLLFYRSNQKNRLTDRRRSVPAATFFFFQNNRGPWNAKPDARILADGIPKLNLWAYDPNGINQIGCVYTAQGFEFDYAGIIFGNDLTYNFDQQTWNGHPEKSADNIVKRSKNNFTELIKNTYRVLLSRGMKGCYIYFLDKDTEKFFKSRIEK